MNIKKTVLSASILLSCLTVAAQEPQTVTEYEFNPHWYIQGQIGGQETLGETSFGKLFAPNAQLGAGYQFTPVWGLRLSVNAWESKASIDFNGRHRWNWNYVAPMIDGTLSVSNLLWGYNPTRLVNVSVLAGIGVNVGFNNGDAVAVNDMLGKQVAAATGQASFPVLHSLWDGTKARFMGRFGAAVDFRCSDKVSVGLELQANTLADGYNSKRAGNADWFFNGLVGVKYTFGKSYTKKSKAIPAVVAEPVVTERVVEKVVEVPVTVEKMVPCPEAQQMTRDVFFTISNTTISKQEEVKVTEIADFLKAHPEAKVTVSGYADKGTGSRAINLRLSKQRAQVVVDQLINKYGIAADRITMRSMGDAEEQPYTDPVLNRVAICIAK